jgi:PPOX class probable F420-dependent enzyme
LDIEPGILTALLECWPIGRLATVTPGGAPHVQPVVFVADAGCVYSPVDAKRKSASTLARVRNVHAHGHASLLLDGYCEDWSQLWWVRLDCSARVERDDTALLERAALRLRAKYPQYRTLEPYAGRPTLLALRWERVSAWAQSGDLAAIRGAAGMPNVRWEQ